MMISVNAELKLQIGKRYVKNKDQTTHCNISYSKEGKDAAPFSPGCFECTSFTIRQVIVLSFLAIGVARASFNINTKIPENPEAR